MRRDLDLIRALLLKLEQWPMEMGDVVTIVADDPAIAVEGYTTHQIHDHLSWILERGLVEQFDSQPMMGITFSRLSWEGADFLDAVRDPEVWRKTKRATEGAGGFSMELVRDLARGFIKKQIEEHTGIKL